MNRWVVRRHSTCTAVISPEPPPPSFLCAPAPTSGAIFADSPAPLAAQTYIVEYLDEPAGPVEPGWISRAGKARVTYPNGNVFEGNFNEDKRKEGDGKYTWSSNAEGPWSPPPAEPFAIAPRAPCQPTMPRGSSPSPCLCFALCPCFCRYEQPTMRTRARRRLFLSTRGSTATGRDTARARCCTPTATPTRASGRMTR